MKCTKNKFTKKISIPGGSQTLTLNKEWRVATVEQKSNQGAWKTIWNYDTGFIASKVLPERACYISIMNRKKMPSFDALPRLAEQDNSLKGHGHPSKDITFTLIKRPIRDLKSYGPDIFSMCRGLPTYVAYEYHGVSFLVMQMLSCDHTFLIKTSSMD
ncbi:gastrokine-1-like [Dryobates pubescens]|uniref:gastrokine-1-like n=1 Tax=Dryobates pubescens TaxID=118200 RepID=UPI0023BA2216|nr:gastrokine-1-like [Dryobates pubescens]